MRKEVVYGAAWRGSWWLWFLHKVGAGVYDMRYTVGDIGVKGVGAGVWGAQDMKPETNWNTDFWILVLCIHVTKCFNFTFTFRTIREVLRTPSPPQSI